MIKRQLVQLLKKDIDIVRRAFPEPVDCFLKGFTVNWVTISLKFGDDKLFILALHGAN